MYQYDDPTCAAALPTPAAAGTPGYFTDGNPSGGVAATELRSDFMNTLMMELLNPVTSAGITPNKTNNAQLLAALQACFAPLVGEARNLAANIAAASTSGTWTADEIVLKSALGGLPFVVKNLNASINLAGTNGAGAMDTGSAPANGFVAIYAIYNPSTKTLALLGVNTTNALAPEIYGGANMPAGYTASTLVSVMATNASSQFRGGTQRGRDISVLNLGVLTISTNASTVTAYTTTAFPKNAKKCKFYSSFTINASGTCNAILYADSAGTDQAAVGITVTGAAGIAGSAEVLISNPQTLYYTLVSSGGAVSWAVNLERYTF